MRWLAIFLLFIPWLCIANDKPSIEVKLRPEIRLESRGWQYFKKIPCERINQVKAASESEQQMIVRRRQDCVNRYKAFLPKG